MSSPVETSNFHGLRATSIKNFPVSHFFFNRTGGFSEAPFLSFNCAYRSEDPRAAENRKKLFDELSLYTHSTRILNPCHGSKIAVLCDKDFEREKHGILIGTDAAITRTAGAHFVMSTADCIPLLITDASATFVAIVHIGWRNAVANFVEQVCNVIVDSYRIEVSDIQCAIGPSIGPCCYIYENPVQLQNPAWHPYLHQIQGQRYAIDLLSAVKGQLAKIGLAANQINDCGICTNCHIEDYFSCYAEGVKSGRFPTIVCLPA